MVEEPFDRPKWLQGDYGLDSRAKFHVRRCNATAPHPRASVRGVKRFQNVEDLENATLKEFGSRIVIHPKFLYRGMYGLIYR